MSADDIKAMVEAWNVFLTTGDPEARDIALAKADEDRAKAHTPARCPICQRFTPCQHTSETTHVTEDHSRR